MAFDAAGDQDYSFCSWRYYIHNILKSIFASERQKQINELSDVILFMRLLNCTNLRMLTVYVF